MARRRLISAFCTIDIRDMKQRGWTSPLKGGQFVWSRGGRPFLTVTAVTMRNGREILFRYDGAESIVPIVTTAQRLGGERQWFSCVYCDRRCAVLYGPPFMCRECRHIAYPSQRRSPDARAMDKCFRLRRAAGASAKPGVDSLCAPFPKRPHGMHRSTYSRLAARYQVAEDRHWRNSGVVIERLTARFRRAGIV